VAVAVTVSGGAADQAPPSPLLASIFQDHAGKVPLGLVVAA
jgi:hypothetical protein